MQKESKNPEKKEEPKLPVVLVKKLCNTYGAILLLETMKGNLSIVQQVTEHTGLSDDATERLIKALCNALNRAERKARRMRDEDLDELEKQLNFFIK